MSLLHISRKAYRNLTTIRKTCFGLIGRCGSPGGIRSAFGRRAIDAFWMEPTKTKRQGRRRGLIERNYRLASIRSQNGSITRFLKFSDRYNKTAEKDLAIKTSIGHNISNPLSG
jgi:hypothetical protein